MQRYFLRELFSLHSLDLASFSAVSDLFIHPESSVNCRLMRSLFCSTLPSFFFYFSFSISFHASQLFLFVLLCASVSRDVFAVLLALSELLLSNEELGVFGITDVLLLLVLTSCECLPSSSICNDPCSFL